MEGRISPLRRAMPSPRPSSLQVAPSSEPETTQAQTSRSLAEDWTTPSTTMRSISSREGPPANSSCTQALGPVRSMPVTQLPSRIQIVGRRLDPSVAHNAVDFEPGRAACQLELHPGLGTCQIDAGHPVAVEDPFTFVLLEDALLAGGGGDPPRRHGFLDAVAHQLRGQVVIVGG